MKETSVCGYMTERGGAGEEGMKERGGAGEEGYDKVRQRRGTGGGVMERRATGGG
jgi:hypothetical protein